MKRRYLLKALGLGCIGFGIAPEILAKTINGYFAGTNVYPDDELKDYLFKIQNFNNSHEDDMLIESNLYTAFESTVMRLRRLQKLVGHGNFNILSFTDGLSLARNYSKIGKFTKQELSFMELTFYADGRRYGFLGQKPLKEITDQVKKKDVVKIPYSGNYLYKERSVEIFESIKKELREQVVLTSGIRGVVKQFLLFLNKVYSSDGNLSLASRSLAPPGYSFHGNGDFDVGQAGYGALNFTGRFTETEVYKRLSELGYLKLRYPQDNRLGVRYEPWHIKISAVV
ncbi:MAG: D-alanyl-D-alanine carboxypeptidase family protein [Proteobacteria bacterium]|nr:D-alanyl-D-alanine carboxypeptidase family protein [Pseudomonadota bacterium]MCH8976456.1 D-alanyl-D-alanine carboxypeptidase family protein [Pseudomonadota bacterium]